VKGNVYGGQPIDAAHPWQSVWFEAGSVAGPVDELAPVFRKFVLTGMAPHSDTRKPLVFYNTWNYQERQKWWAHRDYLESINLDRALKEIEVAHQMGIDVYVLDTGWYRTTGDWQVSPERFPDGLQQIRRKLDSYGMRLGLWFGPSSAAVSSQTVHDHPEWRASWNSGVGKPNPVWGTEPSYAMCMVSGYSHAFAQKVIEVARATGATYFKWDAVGQHACNDPHHDHGTEANTPEERDASYAFQMIGRMTQAAAEISAAIPGSIVDMDVTESGRAFGLGFLASGKFFLVNNGPYLFDYDLPMDKEKDNWNLFFYPGPARTWIARTPLALDKWIPSTLFLTHYFPDDPANLQELNIGSMILGQDGIWGDLTAISPGGVRTMAALISRYKQVRDDMASADPIVTGLVSGSPEIHEKIAANGRGAVVLFATTAGTYEYTTQHAVSSQHWSSNPVQVRGVPGGRAHITAEFREPGARIVYFGIPE
jgi:alpha-galactosidase